MQHGIGGTAHGNIQAHGILEGLEVSNGPGQNAGIILFVPTAGEVNHQAPRFEKEGLAIGVRRHQGPIAGKAQPQSLC